MSVKDDGGPIAGIEVPREAITNGPDIQWNHIDGPVMWWAGQSHWLTWRERARIFIGGAPAIDAVANARFPHTYRLRAMLAARTGEKE